MDAETGPPKSTSETTYACREEKDPKPVAQIPAQTEGAARNPKPFLRTHRQRFPDRDQRCAGRLDVGKTPLKPQFEVAKGHPRQGGIRLCARTRLYLWTRQPHLSLSAKDITV